jgi:hypothetical protein
MKRLPGRRVQIFEVQTKLRPINVEIRLEKSGIFYALWAGERLEDTDLDALRTKLGNLIRAHENELFTFKSYIEYRLTGNEPPSAVLRSKKREKRETAGAGIEAASYSSSDCSR